MTQAPGPTVPLPKRPAPPGSEPTPAASTKLVLVAIGVALLAVLLVNVYIYGVKQSVAEGEFRFFRLRVPKEVGSALTMEDVELVSVPERFRDAFRDVVEPNSIGEPLRLGDSFTQPADQGQPLVTRMFDDLTGEPRRTLIQAGFRGVALPVVSKTLPDPLMAEMHVDLLAPVRGSGGRREIVTVMENVRVVSVGTRNIVDEQNNANGSAGSFETLTVQVSPQQAVQLEAISEEISNLGVFTVLLRNPEDNRPLFIPEGGINPDLLERFGLSSAAANSR